jgi:predicted methyltransferase
MRHPLLRAMTLVATAPIAILTAHATTPSPPSVISAAIAAAVTGPDRTEANKARDRYRHPAETLAFLGVAPGQTLAEYSPGGGWYTEILGPLLRDKGHYIALVSASPRAQEGASKLFAARAAALGPNARIATLDTATGTTTLAPASVDTILTFRNIHNLMMNSDTAAPHAFAAFYKALKPGGVLGVVDHRLPEARDAALEKTSGYIKRSTIVKFATDAGFRLAAESGVNANPRDTADHPGGVWTLPPTLARGETDRAKYLAIGESDRMTLKFIKPE